MPGATNYTEADLVQSLKQRDRNAFDYLYSRYSGALYAAILNIIPDKETANDILQEVFVKIWRQLDQYDPAKGRLFTWMLNVARNASIDFTRGKQFKNNQRNTEFSERLSDSVEGASINTDNVGIVAIVKRLPDEYSKLITLAYFKGYTQDEIAKEENMPLGTVKTRIRKGLLELKKRL
ncbi:MAG: sigma-70 family RNA polymerase sigma factor [Chitinophagaceae bacterium]|nr:sigma-70 family RNA polymerase sigma factor [Chitinophagaceae bacterium]